MLVLLLVVGVDTVAVVAVGTVVACAIVVDAVVGSGVGDAVVGIIASSQTDANSSLGRKD